MMKTKLVLAAFLVVVSWVHGQELGYFQRRVFIEIDGQAQFPLFQNLFGEKMGYRNQNGTLQKSYNLLDAGFRVSLNVTNQEFTSFGIEFGQKFYWLNLSNSNEFGRRYVTSSGNTIDENIRANVAYVPVQETQIMPRFVFSMNDSRAPLGFASEFGIGYNMISFANRHPGIQVDSTGPYSLQEVDDRLMDSRIERLNGLNIMYGFRLNMPINKRLLFHIGFRYQYHYLFGRKKYRAQDDSEYWFSSREIWQKLNVRRQLSIASFGAGFTIML